MRISVLLNLTLCILDNYKGSPEIHSYYAHAEIMAKEFYCFITTRLKCTEICSTTNVESF